MKNFFYCILFYFGSVLSNSSLGQSISSPNAVQFKSPQVASIEKVGLVPTNLSTGQINPSIEIYTFQTPEMDIPITLNYSNTGLKIGENTTWVGLGWNLFIGGVISQNIKGISDDGTSGLLTSAANNDLYRFIRNQMTQEQKDLYLINIFDSQGDSERDLFTFNFMGRSGSFYFDSTGVIRQFQRNDLKITYSLVNNLLSSFTVIDERGFTYLFNIKELSSYSDGEITSNEPIVVNGNSWYLSSIVTPKNDTISFTYDDDVTFNDVHNSYSLAFGARNNSSGCSVDYSMNNVTTSQVFPTASQKKIKQITTAYGKIIFNTTALREDLKDANGNKGNALSEIVVQDNSGKVVKRASFIYGHFLDNNNLQKNRLKLISVSLCGTDCINQLKYQFSYFNETSSFPALQSASKDFDHWGYYNGAGNTTQIPAFNANAISGVGGSYNGANKNANSTYSRYGMLKSITYPTGGASIFEYEGNTVDLSAYSSSMPLFINTSNITSYEVGGNRIKSINYSDPVTNTQTHKYYGYSTETALKYIPNYLSIKDYIYDIATLAYGACGNTYFISDHPLNGMPGFDIEYLYATEQDDVNGINGYKKFTFSKSDDIGSYSQPFPTVINTGWRAGQLLSIETYKKNSSGGNDLVQKVTNSFSTSTYVPMTIGLNSVKISRKITGTGTVNPAGVNYYETGLYSYFTEQTSFNQSSQYNYDGTNQVLSTENYFYESQNHFQKTRQTSITSKNETRTTQYKYPFDFSTVSPYQNMITSHMISPVIEQIETNTTSGQELSKAKSDFQLWQNNTLILPSLLEKSSKGNNYETELTINQYNSKGNVLQATAKNGIVTTYLWGYNNLYPVVKVIGSDFTTVSSFVNQAISDNATGSYSDQQIRDELNKIRTGLAGTKALVNTYTYAPQIGITSETDPTGKTTFYEYDGLNKLKNIKDYQGNIVKNFQYNYQNSCGNNCVVLPMQTYSGSNTIGYPVGVFNVNGQLLGNVNSQADYVTMWNLNTANQAKGVLSAGTDALHFNLALASGQTASTAPTGVMGLRYYQVDLDYNSFDGARIQNGEYVDWGDGTGSRIGIGFNPLAPGTNSTIGGTAPYYYVEHSYSNNNLKTLTFYHNDAYETSVFDNMNVPSTSLAHLQNFRGYLPQFTQRLGGSGYQQSTMNSISGILNWNTISSIIDFIPHNGDNYSPCTNMNYSQNFMANNTGLKFIRTSLYGPYRTGYRDLNFKISRLKADWNSYFTNLEAVQINEDHWNHEDISGLKKLNNFWLTATTQNHLDDPNSPLLPLTSQVIDNVIIQIANGAVAAGVKNGILLFRTGGSVRTAASATEFNQIKAAGWTIYFDSVAQ